MAKDYAKTTFKTTRMKKQQHSRRIFFGLIFLIVVLALGAIPAWFAYKNKTAYFSKENVILLLGDIKKIFHHPKSQNTNSEVIKSETAATATEEPDIHFDFYSELPHMQVTLPATQTEMNKNTPPVANHLVANSTNHSTSTHSTDNDATLSKNSTATSKPDDSAVADALIASNKPDISATANNLAHETNSSNHLMVENHSDVATIQQNNPSSTSKTPVKWSNSLANKGQYIVQVGAYKSDSTASEMRVSFLLAGFDVKVVKIIKANHAIYRIQQGPYRSLAEAKNAQKNLQTKGFDGVVQKLN